MPEFPEVEKHLQAISLTDKYLGEFEAWREGNDAFQTLDLPEPVGNVFIPQRILEISDDPSNVRTVVRHWDGAHYVTILEHLPKDLSDVDAFQKFMKETGGKRPMTNDPYLNTDAPPGVDYMHVRFMKDIIEGRIHLDDKIYLQYSMKKTEGHPNVVETINFFDRPELHGQGIGGSFYSGLESVLKSLGFEFIAGQIWSPHSGFFSKTRKPYEEFDESDKMRLPTNFASVSSDGFKTNWMIKKL